MTVIAKDTLKEIEEYVNSANTKLAILVGYDDATGKWAVAKVDSTTGKISVNAS